MAIGATCLGLVFAALAMLAVPSALAAAPEFTLRNSMPDEINPGRGIKSSITAVNTGTAAFTGTATITDTLPEGMKPAGVEPDSEWGGQCEISGQQVICGFETTELQPIGQLTMWFEYEVDENISEGPKQNVMEVTGNGGANEETVENTITVSSGPAAPFGIKYFFTDVLRAGFDETQAGSTPEVIDTRFSYPTSTHALFEFKGVNQFAIVFPAEHMKTTLVHTPPGVVANLHATPVQCTATQLSEQSENSHLSNCPADSQIGTARILGERTIVPVYNMVAPRGTPAQFGFSFANVSIYITAHLRPSDFGFDLLTPHINSALPLSDTDVELWGIPADPSHDTARYLCLDGDQGNSKYYQHDGICPTKAERKAFFRLPTSCSGQPLDWSLDVDTYEHPGVFHTGADTTPAQVGCNQLEFTPSVTLRPTTNVGDSPAGLEFNLHLPQNEDPDGLAEAELKDQVARFPEGLTANTAVGDGLGACSPQQIGLLTAVGQVPAKFDGAHAACPSSSKLGSVSIYAPAVGSTLPGLVYIATPHENPFGTLVALYIAVDDPLTGIVVKIPVKVELDPNTGQLTTTVEEAAPLPFEDLTVELDQGPHAALRTPISCGTFATETDMTPWSAPEGQDAHPTDSFEIVKGAGGGACASSEATAPSAPSFEGGTLEPRAGIYSPLVVKLARRDGTQQLSGVDLTLPEGLLARIGSYSTYCSNADLAAAAAKSGQQEQAHPSCSSYSEVGAIHAASGAGPAPLHVDGKVYLAGPYKGAPLSLAVITPAVAGPFDLGTVVVRVAVFIDHETTQVHAVSDPLPHILQGVPLDLRQVTLDINRPNYTLNPTSCDPMALAGSVSLLSGQSASVSSPFQVGGCTTLPFKPKLALTLKGGTTRTKHPALMTTLSFPHVGANIASASVALPSSEILDQSHIGTICTRVQFAADQCPARSVYGTARATTPLLDQPLEGLVYLRSSSHKLPDLVAALRGQIDVDLVGSIDSKNGGLRATFASVPDAPVTKFTLSMQGGSKGLLQNSTNICRGKHKATALFEGQNGTMVAQKPVVKAHCGSSRHRRGRSH